MLCGGKQRSAEAPKSWDIFAIFAASILPSEYTPLIIGNLSPISSSVRFKILFCSSKCQAYISDECPLTVIAEMPFVEAQKLICFLVSISSMDRSSLNESNVAGITPSNLKIFL